PRCRSLVFSDDVAVYLDVQSFPTRRSSDLVSHRLGGRWIGRGEEVVREGERVDERGVKGDEAFGNLFARRLRVLVPIQAEGAQQHLAQHAEGRGPCVRQAVGFDDGEAARTAQLDELMAETALDRKSTRLNSSHGSISY